MASHSSSDDLSSIPKAFQDSVKKLLCKTAVHLMKRVKLETKTNKFEDRILVLTAWRFYLFGMKTPAKVDSSFNYLEIKNLITQLQNQLVIETEKSTYSIRIHSLENLDQVVSHVNFALTKIFPGPSNTAMNRQGTYDSLDSTRNTSPNSEVSSRMNRSACGGFSDTYAALCDYNGLTCREEVQWDVDTIYHSQDNREFNLLDFSHLESRDLALIVASLAYNQWFSKLSCKDLRLGADVIEQILHTISKSSNLEYLVLENTGLKTDFLQKLALALSENPNAALHSISLSGNQLEEKGIWLFSQQLSRFYKGMKHMNLSRTSITAKGLISLSQALTGNPVFTSTLTYLDLSKNSGMLVGEEASALYLFLAQPNSLMHLDLSGTDCAVDTLFGALLHGCCTHLTYLNLAQNAFSHKKVKDILPSFKQFFSSAFSLNYINLSGIKLPVDALKALLQGLSLNPHIADANLDLSCCELKSAGAHVFEETFADVQAVGTLDLSDNGFDSDMVTLVPALGKNKFLKHLSMGKNFNVKSRTLEDIINKIVHLIQEEDCALQSLSVADSRLKSRTSILINALGSNVCLTKVDISGNIMEDIGAKMLAKALQINSTLRTVLWDRNNITATGFTDVARALENNYSVKYMPIPVSDVTQAYRSNPEKTEEAIQKIQCCLLRNNQTQKFSQEQAFRLHQGIVTSTTDQMMDRLCIKVQNDVKALRGFPVESIQEDVHCAKEIMKDARNSRALFPSLYELGHILAADGPIRHKLESVASEVSRAVDKELQVILDSMVNLTEDLCPYALRKAESHKKMLSAISDRVTVSRSFVRTVLLEQAGVEIQNKLNELKLTVVTYLTNSIVEEILQELYVSHKKLTRHIFQLRRLADQEEGLLELLQEKQSKNKGRDSEETTDDELSTSIDTIAIRKQTFHSRRIRPVSAFISLSEQDLYRQGTDIDSPSGWQSSSTSSQYSKSRSTSFEALIDLPTEGVKLEHHTRGRPRPRRNNRQAPSRLDINQVIHQTKSENGTVTKLDEGLDDFFYKRVIPDNIRWQSRSNVDSSPSQSSLDHKQKRQRRGIFNFRKPKILKHEKNIISGPELESSPLQEETTNENLVNSESTLEDSWKKGDESEKPVPHGVRPVQNILLPGMGGIRGLPNRSAQEHSFIEDARTQEERAGYTQPVRIVGIALPGMGSTGGQKSDGTKEPTDLENETNRRAMRRYSEGQAVHLFRKPEPPPQLLKPSLTGSRRSSATCNRENRSNVGHEDEVAYSILEDRNSSEKESQTARIPPKPAARLRHPAIEPITPKEKAFGPEYSLILVSPIQKECPPTKQDSSLDSRLVHPSGTDSALDGMKQPAVPTPAFAKPHLNKDDLPETREEPYEVYEQGSTVDDDDRKRKAPLKPKRSKRAQSCDKLESDRSSEPEQDGTTTKVFIEAPRPAVRKMLPRNVKSPLNKKFMSLDGTVILTQGGESTEDSAS